MKAYNFCNNCGKTGHQYHNCKSPITSIGIIAFKRVKDEIKYLLICRKHSLGFVDFMRGKYPLHNIEYLNNIINEMTIEEKKHLRTNTFDELWTFLWGNFLGIQYRGEEKTSKDKFHALKDGVMIKNELYTLDRLIEESDTAWKTPEWGFPKGRRNYQERDLTCAIREFEEETGYDRNKLCIISNLIPFEEIFTGSNYKSYKHKYFLALADESATSESDFQKEEVSELKWKTYQECIDCIRPYNLEKLDIIKKVNNILKEYSLFS
tara:strand:+ start:7165 stop:7959 length:795 start_codon:yes stop_codon:yes gene_type:complete